MVLISLHQHFVKGISYIAVRKKTVNKKVKSINFAKSVAQKSRGF